MNILSAATLNIDFLLFQKFLQTNQNSDSFPQSACILTVVENLQIGFNTFRSSQIPRRLSELQSCFWQLKLFILQPKMPLFPTPTLPLPLQGKNTKNNGQYGTNYGQFRQFKFKAPLKTDPPPTSWLVTGDRWHVTTYSWHRRIFTRSVNIK